MSRKKWVLVILFGVIMVANIYMLWTRCVPISDVMAASIPAVFFRGWVAHDFKQGTVTNAHCARLIPAQCQSYDRQPILLRKTIHSGKNAQQPARLLRTNFIFSTNGALLA